MNDFLDLFGDHFFRVVITQGFDGPHNMAADEVLLTGGRVGEITLRFYDWSPPTLSLGYFQRLNPRQLEEYRRKGIPLVRRPTGGRAVFHDQEITYSVTWPRKKFPGRSWSTPYYSAISQFLLWGLERLGVRGAKVQAPKEIRRGQGEKNAFWCFEHRNFSEISLGGKKLVGSAQRLYPYGLLQHGSILGRINLRPEFQELWPRKADGSLLATSLEEVLGRKPGLMEVAGVYTEVLQERSIPWKLSDFGQEEVNLIADLARQKYQYLDWPFLSGELRVKSQELKDKIKDLCDSQLLTLDS